LVRFKFSFDLDAARKQLKEEIAESLENKYYVSFELDLNQAC